MLCHRAIFIRGFLIVGHQVLQESVCLHKLLKESPISIHVVKASIFGVTSSLPVRENVRRGARAEEIIKQAVIDGILMEEDGSISNISRF